MASRGKNARARGWKSQLRHAVQDMATTHAKQAAKAAAGAAARANGSAAAQRAGMDYIGSGPRRALGSAQGLPASVRQDSLPMPSPGKLGIAAAAGAGIAGTAAAGTVIANPGNYLGRKKPSQPKGNVAGFGSGGQPPTTARIVNRRGDYQGGWSYDNPIQNAEQPRGSYPLIGGAAPSVLPAAFGSSRKFNQPKMWAKAKAGDVTVTVEHTEYVRDLVGTGFNVWTEGETVFQDAVNPGNPNLFGWLSGLAALFDEYQFSKLEFAYDPAVGSSSNGKMLMTFDPDVVDETPSTKQVMLQARAQSDSTPWLFSHLKVPKDMLSEHRYVRSGNLPAGTDPHVYDVGALNIAFPGAPAAMIGELFVTYRVTFFSPNGGAKISGYQEPVQANVTVAAPLGDGTYVEELGPLTIERVSGTAFTLPFIGDYMMLVNNVGTVITAAAAIAAAGPNSRAVVQSLFTATGSSSLFTIRNTSTTAEYNLTIAAATITETYIYLWPVPEGWI